MIARLVASLSQMLCTDAHRVSKLRLFRRLLLVQLGHGKPAPTVLAGALVAFIGHALALSMNGEHVMPFQHIQLDCVQEK